MPNRPVSPQICTGIDQEGYDQLEVDPKFSMLPQR